VRQAPFDGSPIGRRHRFADFATRASGDRGLCAGDVEWLTLSSLLARKACTQKYVSGGSNRGFKMKQRLQQLATKRCAPGTSTDHAQTVRIAVVREHSNTWIRQKCRQYDKLCRSIGCNSSSGSTVGAAIIVANCSMAFVSPRKQGQILREAFFNFGTITIGRLLPR
jgi:hypothetical protein